MIEPGSQRPRHSSPPSARTEQEQGARPEHGQRGRQGRDNATAVAAGRGREGINGAPSPGDDRGSGGPPSRHASPPQTYQPKPRPKPVVPLTEAMKKGKAPLRTFGDLAQFLQLQQPPAKEEETPTEPPTAPANLAPRRPTMNRRRPPRSKRPSPTDRPLPATRPPRPTTRATTRTSAIASQRQTPRQKARTTRQITTRQTTSRNPVDRALRRKTCGGPIP